MRRPVLLDLFCGAGGAAMGYYTAGFDIIGVDDRPQPNYPYHFIQADWRRGIEKVPADVIHASPPCQAYSAPKSVNGNRGHPRYVIQVRETLRATGIPYVIENVPQAPLEKDIMLCGTMWDLPILRHRHFESNMEIAQLEHEPHKGRVRGWRHGKFYDGPYLAIYGKGGGKATLDEARKAMGVNWMQTWDEVKEAIPPIYTYYVGCEIKGQL